MFNKILSLSFISSLSLSSALYAIGAGVFPTFDDGTVLLRSESHGNVKVWMDHGGPQDPRDGGNKRITATRRGNEKTAFTFPFRDDQLARARYVDHASSRMYFPHLAGDKPSIEELIHNGNVLKTRFPNFPLGETDYKYVDAQLLLTAALGNGLLPGTNEPMDPRFIARIRKDANQLGGGVLQAFIRSPKSAAPIRPFVVPPVNVVTPPPAVPTRAAPPSSKRSRRAAMASRRRAANRTKRTSRRKSVSQSRRIRQQRHASRLRHVRQQRRMSRKSHIRKQTRVSRRSRHISTRRRSR
ncbi:MAG: hypothetical protein BGO67_04595 [Alphaproteobacteria bacterium 41-28]|nr:MAG: hypothetical protein BGO67_04595 [Alphaproteobacteria bacterium 41-28]